VQFDSLFQAVIGNDVMGGNIVLADPSVWMLADAKAELPTPYADAEGNFSDAAASEYAEQIAQLAEIATFLRKMDVKSLSANERRDIAAIADFFDKRATATDSYWFDTDYIGAYGGQNVYLPIYLDMLNLRNEKEVQDYISFISDTARAFPLYAKFELAKIEKGYGRSDAEYTAIAEQCRSFASDRSVNGEHYLIARFAERIAGCDFLTDAQKASYKSSHNATVASAMLPAYSGLASAVELFVGNGGNNQDGTFYYAGGAEYYEKLFLRKAGTSDKVTDAYGAVVAEYNRIIGQIAETKAALMSKYEDVDAAYDEFRNGEHMTQTAFNVYYSTLKAAYTTDFPQLPASVQDPDFKRVIPQLEDYSAPATYFVSQYDNFSANETILTNGGSRSGYHGFEMIAHESIPGHLLQHNYFKTSGGGHILRLTLSSLGYTEGWANYVQFYSEKYYPYEETKDLYHLMMLNVRRSLLLQFIADVRVNYMGEKLNGLTAFLLQKDVASVTAEEMENYRDTYETLISDPASVAPYVYGMLKMEGLREGFDGSDYEFHTAVLHAGSMSFDILGNYL
jgi:uncharacterized protein (DUF885 family)